MLIEKSDISRYIPQRPPFVMIDRLLAAGPDGFEADFRILPDNIFLEKDMLREFALIEHMAQCAAAGIAWLSRHSKQKPANGFMGGISKLKIHALPKSGELLSSHMHIVQQLGQLYLLKGEAFSEGRKLIECELKLAGA